MTELVFFDTETTGIPVWNEPSGGDNQPHIVQLAAALVDPSSREVKDLIDLIVAPDGWEIPDSVAEIHGITAEIATEKGVPEAEALETFLNFWGGRKRIAFNTTFDNRIIRIATKRYSSAETVDHWKAGEYECAMIGSQRVIGGKYPKLAEAYQYFTSKTLEGAHSALVDVMATIELYFMMKDRTGGAR